MNKFERNILKRFKNITKGDFQYFTLNTAKKIKKMGLPVIDCVINKIFIDANERDYIRLEYCLKNCGLRCL